MPNSGMTTRARISSTGTPPLCFRETALGRILTIIYTPDDARGVAQDGVTSGESVSSRT